MGCKHQPHQGKEYIIDIETNGLLDDVTKVHCLVLKDIRSNVIQTFSNDINCNGAVEQGIELINNAELIIGHNIIKYDLPVLRKIYPRCNDLKNVFDTLVASRLIC
jgi:DNA polymerase-1